jgi:hypothetical protein
MPPMGTCTKRANKCENDNRKNWGRLHNSALEVNNIEKTLREVIKREIFPGRIYESK